MRALESWKRRLWFRFPFTPVVSSLVRLSPAARPDGRNLHVAASECQGGCSISVWIELLTHGVQRSLCAARNDIDPGRVRTNKQSVWLARIERERPNSLTWQTILTRVDSRPRQSGISRTINAAADLAILIVLISVAGKNLVGVARVDGNRFDVVNLFVAFGRDALPGMACIGRAPGAVELRIVVGAAGHDDVRLQRRDYLALGETRKAARAEALFIQLPLPVVAGDGEEVTIPEEGDERGQETILKEHGEHGEYEASYHGLTKTAP